MRYIDPDTLPVPSHLHLASYQKQIEQAKSKIVTFLGQTQEKGATRRAPSSDWLFQDPAFRMEVAEIFFHCCAYCERYTGAPEDSMLGQIHHHRPKALAQDAQGRTDFLAYVWLTYEWDNILWVCDDCARRKSTLFLVERKRGQPSDRLDVLRQTEGELFLDPRHHHPEDHLAFQIDGSVDWTTPQGQTTCDVLGLNRDEIVLSRRRAIANLVERLIVPEMFGVLLEVFTNPDWLKSQTGQTITEVLQSQPQGNFDGSLHLGATSQALTWFAKMRGIAVNGLQDLLRTLSSFDPNSRDSFLRDALDATTGQTDLRAETTGGSLPIETAPPPPQRKRRSRIPNLRNLPTARKQIGRVDITHFKALKQITFDLPKTIADPEQAPCMILLGENAMGKSSVLEAMALAVIGADETAELDDDLGGGELAPKDLIHKPDMSKDKTEDHMSVQLDFVDHSLPVALKGAARDSRFTGSDTCAKVVLGYGPRRFFSKHKSRRLRAPAHRVRSLFDPLDMIANPGVWLGKLSDAQFAIAARALREILLLRNEDDFEREPDPDPDQPPRIYITHSGQRTALRDMSVGYKSVIAMACDIMRELLYHYDNIEQAHAVVFIDEIETHLHPRWKMQIMQLLRRAFPRVQFIVTTHDPLCLRGMYDGEVFVLHRDTDTDHVKPVDDLPSIRGMRAEQILTSEYFGLGSTDPETDAALIRYNRLAARIETLGPAERAEMDKLNSELAGRMVMGDTFAQQELAEALKSAVEEGKVAPTRATSERRKDLRSRFSKMLKAPRA